MAVRAGQPGVQDSKNIISEKYQISKQQRSNIGPDSDEAPRHDQHLFQALQEARHPPPGEGGAGEAVRRGPRPQVKSFIYISIIYFLRNKNI